MTALTQSQAKHFAAILDEYEEMIATANSGKKDTLDDIRTVLREAGLKGSDLADELAAFREAVAVWRLKRTSPEKSEKKEKKRDGATDYLFLIDQEASRTHEGRILAWVAAQGDTTFGNETGEINETAPMGSTQSCGSVDGHAGEMNAAAAQEPDVLHASGQTVKDERDRSSDAEVASAPKAPSTIAGVETGPQDTEMARASAPADEAQYSHSSRTLAAAEAPAEITPAEVPPLLGSEDIALQGDTTDQHDWPSGGEPHPILDPLELEWRRKQAMPDIPAFLRRAQPQGHA